MPRRSTTEAGVSLLQNRTHYHARLWKIVRKDGTEIHLTDHDREIQYDTLWPFRLGTAELETYSPVGAGSASALTRSDNLRESTREITGVIDALAITHADMKTGLYKDAEFTEFVVDWRFPFKGAITTDRWILKRFSFTDQVWNVEMVGVANKLTQVRGRNYATLCPYTLGNNSECQRDLQYMQRTGCTVNIVEIPKRRFKVDVATIDPTTVGDPLSPPDIGSGYFAYGRLIWTTGLNVGVISQVARYFHDDNNRIFVLATPTPNAINTTDTFTAEPGCDKGFFTCKNKFNNVVNFGGDPWMPGVDRAAQGPIE